jgi:hypothetical protein
MYFSPNIISMIRKNIVICIGGVRGRHGRDEKHAYFERKSFKKRYHAQDLGVGGDNIKYYLFIYLLICSLFSDAFSITQTSVE